MPKLIVTHQSPDLDALACVWLVRKYRRGWKDASVEFVPSGTTRKHLPADENPDIMHVDTGFGDFDHHQTSDFICGAKKVFEFLKSQNHIKAVDRAAVERIVEVVNRYDHFREVFLDEADDDMHAFSLCYVIMGMRSNHYQVDNLVQVAEYSLDAILHYMKGKVHAEEIIEEGRVIKSPWGKTLVLETDNDFAMKLAFMKGFDMVLRYSPHYKNVSIKTHPKVAKKLKKLYEAIIKADPDAQWFYHASGRMLLNASTSEFKHKVTRLSLEELVEMVKGA